MAITTSPGWREVLQLLDEDAVVADVVGVRRDGGQGIGERHDAEALCAVVAGALHHVADEVRGGGGAAAVAAREDCAAVFARLRAATRWPRSTLSTEIPPSVCFSDSKYVVGKLFIPCSFCL